MRERLHGGIREVTNRMKMACEFLTVGVELSGSLSFHENH